METRSYNKAFTIIELVMVVSIVTLLLAMLLPAISNAQDNARIKGSVNNLRQIGAALAAYASDWSDRQVTYNRDDLGQHDGDIVEYNKDIYATDDLLHIDAHPPIIAGYAYDSLGQYSGPYGYWSWCCPCAFQPMHFPDFPGECGSTCAAWFRFGIQPRPMHEYFNGKYQDRVFYAPKDRVTLDPLEQCFEVPGEFVAYPEDCNPAVTSYALSPAALFSPHVFADDGGGRFWTPPWTLPNGYRVPSFGQAKYASLKTHVLEHAWLQNQKLACNGAFEGCEPYYFNHSFQSMPATLFYDGSIRLMGVLEAMSSDRRHAMQAGYGLWSRDTSLGESGYLIADGYDFANTSFHILTIDGIRGRDTIGAE